jgi:arabinose-5-phosphate isomerase
MNSRSASGPRFAADQQLAMGREVLLAEAAALRSLSDRIDQGFCEVVRILLGCRGSVILTGMGKAGLIGKKIAATLASTGTPSHFVHPSEAIHGDLGRIQPDDCVMVLSNSGETEEIVNLLPSLTELAIPLIAITSNPASQLARASTVTLDLGATEEACSLGLAPSTSTTAMLALGDALALVVSHLLGFTREDFARYHPGGSLGRKLTKVMDVMRPLEQCCVALEAHSLREIYVQSQRPQRRSGAILLTDAQGRLTGIFTDSDLARLFEHKRDDAIDRPIREVMTATPVTVRHSEMLVEAIGILASRKISELPVIDKSGKPLGLIDITDVVGLLPKQPTAADSDADASSRPEATSGNPEVSTPPNERAA